MVLDLLGKIGTSSIEGATPNFSTQLRTSEARKHEDRHVCVCVCVLELGGRQSVH